MILLVVGVVGILVVDVLGVVDEEVGVVEVDNEVDLLEVVDEHVGVVEVDNEVDLQVDEEHLQRFIA